MVKVVKIAEYGTKVTVYRLQTQAGDGVHPESFDTLLPEHDDDWAEASVELPPISRMATPFGSTTAAWWPTGRTAPSDCDVRDDLSDFERCKHDRP